MSVVLQVSDPHFGCEVGPVLEALVALSARLSPDLLVLSGDLTQRARAVQFDAARAFVDRLAVPARVAIPGNHDIALWNVFARAFAPYAGYRRAFGDVLEPVHDGDDLLVVCLKTTRRYRHVDGELSRAQVERAALRFMSARRGQLRVAVVHQPVAILDPDDEKNLLHGRDLAVRRWAEAGCDLVVGGHIHLPYLVPLGTRYASLPREMWALQAGTSVSSRLRRGAPNSVNVVRTGAALDALAVGATPPGHPRASRRCVVERWDFREADGAFTRVEQTALAFGDGR